MKLLLAALLLSGCATNMVKVAEVDAVRIVWDKRAPLTCGNKPGTEGCAQSSSPYTLDSNLCIITMIEDSIDMVVAHEFRHCFGFLHAEDR